MAEISFDDLIPGGAAAASSGAASTPSTGLSFDDLIPNADNADDGRSFTLRRSSPPADLPSVYSLHPKELENPMGMGATLGASDAQLGDIVEKALGDKFVKREAVSVPSVPMAPNAPPGTRANAAQTPSQDYQVFTTKGPDGQEQQSYLNKPGLDSEDVVRGVRGSLPYFIGGGAAALPKSILGKMLLEGTISPAMSIAGDIAQEPLGSKQGIDGGKAAAMAVLGAATPLASKAAENITAKVGDFLAPTPQALSGTSRGAIKRVSQAMDAAKLDPQAYAQKSTELGPEGMLGDMGETLQTDTARLARMPNTRDVVMQPLEARQEAAPNRIKAATDAALGRPVDMPAFIDAQKQQFSAQAAPLYDQFYNSHIPITPEIRAVLKRANDAGAIKGAQKLMGAEGADPRIINRFVSDPMRAITGTGKTVGERVPNGMEFDYIKRALDDLASNAGPGTNEERIYSGLSRTLRNEVDKTLSPSDPSASPWAQARAVAGEGIEGREAVKLGNKVFSGKKDPQDVRDELGDLSQYGQALYKQGARNDVRQIMGRASSNFGPKGDAAARRALNSEFAGENLDLIAGRKAYPLQDRIAAENAMAETHNMAAGNSITSTMEASKARYPNPAESNTAAEVGRKGWSGLATEGAYRVVDAIVGGALNRQRAKVALDAAHLLVAQGAKRDDVANAIFEIARTKVKTRAQGLMVRKIVQSVLTGARSPAAQYESQ